VPKRTVDVVPVDRDDLRDVTGLWLAARVDSGSSQEAAALKGLTPALNGCLKGKKLGAGGTALRSVIALAAFRNFRAAGG